MSIDEPDADQGRVFSALRDSMNSRTLTARRAAGVISLVTLVLTAASGIAIRLVDPDSFTSLGEGLWWAIQTLTTVGYGDVVPANTAGRVIGAVVMLNGIAFLTVITAAVTAMLIEQARTRARRGPVQAESTDPVTAAALADIDSRLERIEVALARPPDDSA